MTADTESMILRPFTREEYHDFYRRFVIDPIMDTRQYDYQFTHVDKCFDYDQSRMDWYPTFGIFVDGVSVGTLALKRIDREKQRCEIGIMMVNDSCKGRGYGTAAMRQAIRIACRDYHVRHIFADTMGSNLRMQHILEKLGFQLIERIPHVYVLGGRCEDKLDYRLEVTDEEAADWYKQSEQAGAHEPNV